MKKTAAIISVLLSCLLLAGCAAQPAAQNALAPGVSVTAAPIVEVTSPAASIAPAAEAAAPQPTAVAQAALANLYGFTGTVEVETGGESMPAYEGMRLYAGDSLRTGAGSTANLDLDQGRLLMMDADAELRFQEKDDGTLEVYLTKGAILNNVAKGQTEPYTVRAANVTMGVLGTVFRVSIDDVTGVAVTELYEGKLLITFTTTDGQEHSFTLDPGRRFTADEETLDKSGRQNELITEEIYIDDLSPALLDMLQEALEEREDAAGVTTLLEQIENLKQERAEEEQEQNEARPSSAPVSAPIPAPAPTSAPDPVRDDPSDPSDPSEPPASTPTLTPTPAPVSASVSPATASFDRYINAAGYADKTFTLTAGSYVLNAIKIGDDTLALNTDYTVSGSEYTIKKETLGELAVGIHTVTFDMSGGTDPTVTLTVTDSMPAPDVTTFALKHLVEYDGGSVYDDNGQLMYGIEVAAALPDGMPTADMSVDTIEVSADGTQLPYSSRYEVYCGEDGDGFEQNIPGFTNGTEHTVTLRVNYTYKEMSNTLTKTMAVEIGGLPEGAAELSAEYKDGNMHVALAGQFYMPEHAVVPEGMNKVNAEDACIFVSWGEEDDFTDLDIALSDENISEDGTFATAVTIDPSGEDTTSCVSKIWKTASIVDLYYTLPYAYSVNAGDWTVNTLIESMEDISWENTTSIPQIDSFALECVKGTGGQLLYENGLPLFGVRVKLKETQPADVDMDVDSSISLRATQTARSGDLTSTTFELASQPTDTTLYRSNTINDFTGGCTYLVQLNIPYTYKGASYTLIKTMRTLVGGIEGMNLTVVETGTPHSFTLAGEFANMLGGGAGEAPSPEELNNARLDIDYEDSSGESKAFATAITLSGEGIYNEYTGSLNYASSEDTLLTGNAEYAQAFASSVSWQGITLSFEYDLTYSYQADSAEESTDQSVPASFTASWHPDT